MTDLSLSAALGRKEGRTYTLENHFGHRLTVELIPGGLYEIADFQALAGRSEESGVLLEIIAQFESLVLERATLLERGAQEPTQTNLKTSDIRAFFRTYSPQDIMSTMTLLISGVVPDPKAQTETENPPTGEESLPSLPTTTPDSTPENSPSLS